MHTLPKGGCAQYGPLDSPYPLTFGNRNRTPAENGAPGSYSRNTKIRSDAHFFTLPFELTAVYHIFPGCKVTVLLQIWYNFRNSGTN